MDKIRSATLASHRVSGEPAPRPGMHEPGGWTRQTISRRSSRDSVPGRLSAVLLLGLGTGAATSLLQTDLDFPWLGLVNAASPWLTVMFVAGALWPRPSRAAAAGLATGLLELIGYYATSAAKGYAAGNHAILLFWAACALAGGPLFGVAGSTWRRATTRPSSIATAAVPAAFLAEAIVVYGLRLHYLSTALLFAACGFVAFALLGLRRRDYRHLTVCLLLILPIAVTAEFVLERIYRQSL
jgi:hypothetical protein